MGTSVVRSLEREPGRSLHWDLGTDVTALEGLSGWESVPAPELCEESNVNSDITTGKAQ